MSKNNAPRRNAKKTTKKATRSYLGVDWATVDRAIRTVAADAFEAGGYAREASELRACAPINDEDTARAAYLLATDFAHRSLGEQADALVGEIVCVAMAAERGDVSRLDEHRAKIESAVLPNPLSAYEQAMRAAGVPASRRPGVARAAASIPELYSEVFEQDSGDPISGVLESIGADLTILACAIDSEVAIPSTDIVVTKLVDLSRRTELALTLHQRILDHLPSANPSRTEGGAQ